MDENKIQTPDVTVVPDPEPAPTRLQVFVNKHPRAAKIVAITGAITAVAGAAHFARTVHANKDHLELAGEHAKEALNELSTSTSPTDAEA